MTSLLDVWIDKRQFFDNKSIEQIVSMAGDGSLIDGNITSKQLRELLGNLPATNLVRYVDECVSHSFEQSGLMLQDLVNEIGRRLGFSVEPGYYRGSTSRIGFDGIWKTKDDYSFVIEVKTTDAYQLNLDIQAQYRHKLIEEKRIQEDKSSILLVVGRKDTGGLEAQTRGSRHAWDIRIISVDALVKLMRVKENLSDASTVLKIQEILKPLEYTRIDKLIDVIFSTSEDLQFDEADGEMDTADGETSAKQSTPARYHEECVNHISAHLKLPLIKHGRCTYTNSDQSVRILCIVSKEYHRGGSSRYWFAFHPGQQEFLNEAKSSFIALGCGSASQIVMIPFGEFQKHLSAMRKTGSGDRFYWHVEIFIKGKQFLLNKPTAEGIDVSRYKLP